MKKKVCKLELGRETLRVLGEGRSEVVVGGATGWFNTCNESCGEPTRCSVRCF